MLELFCCSVLLFCHQRTAIEGSCSDSGVQNHRNMPAPMGEDAPPKSESRLLLVSNRLPITIKRSNDGKYDFSMSSGGLVTGLSGLAKSTTFQWYGWPGLEIPEEEIHDVTAKLKDEFNAIPVFMADELADRHYNGFSSWS